MDSALTRPLVADYAATLFYSTPFMPRSPANQKAFTLIEVLMAATVLVVGFTAVIQAVMMGAEMIDTARKQQIAQQIIDREIAYQRASPWLPSGSVIGVINMADSIFRIRVNATGTNASDDTADVFNDKAHFNLDNNSLLMAMAKGFTLESESYVLRSAAGTPTYLSIKWTVVWTGTSGRAHIRTSVAYFGQNGLNLSYQK